MRRSFVSSLIKGVACLAIALLAMANKPCFAASGRQSIDYGYTVNGESRFFTEYSETNLFSLISIGAELQGSNAFDDSIFSAFISRLGLASYFQSWDPYNPTFYVNVYYSSDIDRDYYVVEFRKDSFSDFEYSVRDFSDRALVHCNVPFVSSHSSDYRYLYSFPSSFYLGIGNNNFSDTFFFNSQKIGTFTNNVSYGGVTYPIKSYFAYNLESFNISSEFDYFLNNSNVFSFSVTLNYVPSQSRFYEYGYSFNLSSFVLGNNFDCLFSTFYVYDISSNVVGLSPIYKNTDDFNRVYKPYLESFSFDLFDVLLPYTIGIRYSNTQVTPTPVPTPTGIPPWRDSELPTPTAYPSVTFAPLPTGIVTDYIPLLDMPSNENILSNISGIIKEFNSIFSRKVFALGSYTLQVMYYFSGWFKFIFLVPAGVFIAFLIGRLRKK